MKTLIKNGIIIDGSGSERLKADILIDGEHIKAIHSAITPSQDIETTIDATGCIVTPGFVDIHRHFDSAMVGSNQFGDIELRQGITSSICGNCGLSPVPANRENANSFNKYLRPVTGSIPQGFNHYDYVSYAKHLKSVQPKINIGFLAGAGSIAYSIYGWQTRPFLQQERNKAASFVREAMDQGAKGISFGIMYQPECWLSEEDHVAMASQIRKKEGILCTHIRGEGDSLISSVKEVIQIAEKADVKLNISHFKATGKNNWKNLIFKATDIIQTAIQQGQRITVDFYPYDGGATTLLSLIPPSILPASPDDLSFFRTENGRHRLRKEILQSHTNWDNMVKSIGWERILISSVTNPASFPLQGLNMQEATLKCNLDNPSDLVANLLAEDGPEVGVILLSMNYDDIKYIASLPYSCVISDSLYGCSSFPHPRLYGTFPKAIRDFSINSDLLSLEQVISKMTYQPASRVNLKKRGLLQVGNYADILVFDPAIFRDTSTYVDPRHEATGMNHVFINGCHILENDTVLQGCFGKILIE